MFHTPAHKQANPAKKPGQLPRGAIGEPQPIDTQLHKFLASDSDGSHGFIVSGDTPEQAWARCVEWNDGHALTQEGHDILSRVDGDVLERFGPF